MGVRFPRHGAWVYRDPRWKALRYAAKRRDGWACVKCGSKYRLEVDHIAPVRDAPDLAFDLTNLQTLCGPCHGKKTRTETGLPELSPERQRWRDFLSTMRLPSPSTLKDSLNA